MSSVTIRRAYKNKSQIWINLLVLLSVVSSLLYINRYEETINFLRTEWFQQHWHVSFYISLLYLVVIFAGQTIMQAYSPVDARLSLAIWNVSLALFSTYGAYRVVGEMGGVIRERGLYWTYCDNSYHQRQTVYLWYNMFVLSKVVELGDTLFIVVRKQHLQFIHWAHHVITLIYSFYIAAYLPAIGRWMSAMNLSVHSTMYSYYALRALRLSPPRFVSLAITSLQVIQMFVGLLVNSLALYDKLFVGNCQNGGLTAFWGTIMYAFYVFLFCRLFANLYLKPKVKV